MNSSRFEKQQLRELAWMLNCQPDEIQKITSSLKSRYGHNIIIKEDKRTGKPKIYLNGEIKTREINPSYGRLSEIQIAIKNLILREIEFPEHINGGVQGKSNISNAKPHQGKKYILTTDLSNCFPSISHNMVYAAFLGLGLTNIQARWLTKLTTYKFSLPQGTATSPYLANLCLLPLDSEILDICDKHSLTYTRYVDDLTISSSSDFSEIIPLIISKITSHGLKISRRKTIYSGNQNITGIDIYNNYIDAPSTLKEKAMGEKKSFKPLTNYINRIRNTNIGVKRCITNAKNEYAN